jgi:hypothetical protein
VIAKVWKDTPPPVSQTGSQTREDTYSNIFSFYFYIYHLPLIVTGEGVALPHLPLSRRFRRLKKMPTKTSSEPLCGVRVRCPGASVTKVRRKRRGRSLQNPSGPAP